MKIIDRYLVREIAVAAAFAVAVLSGVLVFGNLLRKLFDVILNDEIPLKYVGTFAACLIPFCLTFTIPWGFVTAVLLVFGRLSAENELTALRTTGVTITRICAPVLVFAVITSAFCLWLNAALVPLAQSKMKKTFREIAKTHPAALVPGDRVMDQFPGKRIYIGRKSGSTLSNICIFELNEMKEPTRVLFARSGEIGGEAETHELQMRLKGARVEEWPAPFDPGKIHETFRIASGDTSVSLDQLFATELRRPPLATMTLSKILRERGRLEETPASIAYEINRRLAFSFACVALTFVALPLAVGVHRREPVIGFGLSILVTFGYFLVVCAANSYRHHPEAHPEMTIWLANLLFLGGGALLFRRMQRQ